MGRSIPRACASIALVLCISLFPCAAVLYLSSSPVAAQGESLPPSPTWQVPRFAQSPTIDGNLEEWAHLPSMRLGIAPHQVIYSHNTLYSSLWGGPLDLSAKGWLAWDEKCLYFATEVTDNLFVQERASNWSWENDSAQIALDPWRDQTVGRLAEDDREYAFSLAGANTIVFNWNLREEEKRNIPAKAVKKSDGRGWSLEAAIPWEEIGVRPRAGLQMGFSWMVNDSDTGWRDGWVEWTGGMGKTKDASLFGTITLIGNSQIAKSQEEKDYLRELAAWQKILAEDVTASDASLAQLWSGQVHAAYGEYDLAAQAYAKFLSRYPGDENIAAGVAALSELQAKMGKAGEGAVLLETFIKTHLDQPAVVSPALSQLAELLTRSEGPEAARARLLKLAETIGSGSAALTTGNNFTLLTQIHLARAGSYRAEGNPAAAVKELGDLITLLPDGSPLIPRVFQELRNMVVSTAPTNERTLKALMQAVASLGDRAEVRDHASVEDLRLFAWAYKETGDTAKATAQLQEIIQRFPADAEARLRLADLDLKKGNFQDAEISLRAIVQNQPSSAAAAEAGLRLGDLCRQRGNFRQALRRYRVVAAHPDFDPSTRAMAFLFMGDLLGLQMKDYAAALKAYRSGIRLEPSEVVRDLLEQQVVALGEGMKTSAIVP